MMGIQSFLLLLVLPEKATAFVSNVARPYKFSALDKPTTTSLQSVPVPLVKTAIATLGGIVIPSSTIKIVSQGNNAILERLGRYQKTLQPGLHFVIPLVDRLRITIPLREQVFDIPPQDCISLDNAPLSADAVVYWKVLDPEKAYYSVTNLELAIQNLVLTQLRSEIGKLTLDATFTAREQINQVLLQDLDIATEPWGIKITRVEVRDIIPNDDIRKALEQQMAAERHKRAVVIESEGQLARKVNEAEGEAQSRLIDAKASAEAVRLQAEAQKDKLELEAKGAADGLKAVVDALDGNVSEATKFQLVKEYIEAQKALATSPNAKVLLSQDAFNSAMAEAVSLYDVTKNK